MQLPLSRRHFLKSSAAIASGALFTTNLRATHHGSYPLKGRLFKTLKINMIKIDGSLTERFQAAKRAGFMGVEMNSPGMDVAKTRRAIAESGLPVDGTVCSSHWKIRHSSPDATTRAQALQDLKIALRDTHAVGGHTVLLVVGKGEDGPESEIWPRSIENIRQAIPLAAELGVSIVIENVWNQFLYDHEGGSDQTAERFVRYVDEFRSPWVGMQFDIGNHWKYGSMGDWLRSLGKRVIKLDVKGFSRTQNKFMRIGEGDIDFLDVRKALHDINYHGWVAAEVKGGDFAELKKISSQMDRVFGL
ncbi:MAG: sugar phosphate isomerase/epimerase family protein [Verrucomicrobiota bacterium]|nr:sugar phosphate isomerase/epimerase family protein [Verrucomicrobiota bacterium]